MYVTGVTEKKKREKRAEKILEEIMFGIFEVC